MKFGLHGRSLDFDNPKRQFAAGPHATFAE
jgi:hypothetical protein